MLSLVGEKLQQVAEVAEYGLKQARPREDLTWRESWQGADRGPARPLHCMSVSMEWLEYKGHGNVPSSFSFRSCTSGYCAEAAFDVSAVRGYKVEGVRPFVDKVTTGAQNNAMGENVRHRGHVRQK